VINDSLMVLDLALGLRTPVLCIETIVLGLETLGLETLSLENTCRGLETPLQAMALKQSPWPCP